MVGLWESGQTLFSRIFVSKFNIFINVILIIIQYEKFDKILFIKLRALMKISGQYF